MTPTARRTSSVLAGLAVVATLAACGAGSRVGGANVPCDVDPPSSDTTVDVLAYSAPAMDPFTDAMVNGCGDVDRLTVRHGPVDFNAQLEKAPLSLSADEGTFDVVETYSGTLAQYASQDWLAPLDDFYREQGAAFGLDDVDPRLLEKARYDGRLYQLPTQANVHVLAYREDLLRAAGVERPPRTWDELVDAARRVEADGRVDHALGLAYSADADVTTAFGNSLVSLGGRWLDPATDEPELTSDAAVAAVESLRRALPHMPDDAMRADGVSVTTKMQNGDLAMAILYTGSMAAMSDPRKSRHADDLAFAPPPSVEPGGRPWATLNLDGFSVAANTDDDVDLVAQVAAVGASEEAAQSAGRLAFPVRRSLRADPGLAAKAPYWAAAATTLDRGADTYPAKPYFVPLQTAVRPYVADAVSGRTPVREALRLAQAEAERVVARSRGGGG